MMTPPSPPTCLVLKGAFLARLGQFPARRAFRRYGLASTLAWRDRC